MVGWIIAAGALFLIFRKKTVQAQSGPTLPTLPPSEIPYVGAATIQANAGLLTFDSSVNQGYIPAISGPGANKLPVMGGL